VLEFRLLAHRGIFQLHVDCCFASEWTVLFGPSGAGKSMLLRLLAGLDRPHEGWIRLDKRTLTDEAAGLFVPPGRRRIALVAQQPALFPHLNVAANVGYGLAAVDRKERSQRTEEMLNLVGAAHLSGRQPRELSGGEAQRVALARALARLPRLLLLDEPFAALDGVASDELLIRLRSWLGEHGMLTVLVTHDATDAWASGAEVALLQAGKVVALGPASTTLAAERTRIMERLKVK
jgi:ABC-type sulfate/molybdate transport systems ATPase subunit